MKMKKIGPVTRLIQDYKKLNEKYLRSLAEFDNYRKRRDREMEEVRKFCAESVIKDIIPVLDDFERALNNSAEDDPLHKGVKMIYSHLLRVLEAHGLKGYSCMGESFDPRKAEVISSVEREDVEEGTIVDEFQKGYMIWDKIIRPAKVVVAKKKQGGESNG